MASLQKSRALRAASHRLHSIFVSIAHAQTPARMNAAVICPWRLGAGNYDIALRCLRASHLRHRRKNLVLYALLRIARTRFLLASLMSSRRLA